MSSSKTRPSVQEILPGAIAVLKLLVTDALARGALACGTRRGETRPSTGGTEGSPSRDTVGARRRRGAAQPMRRKHGAHKTYVDNGVNDHVLQRVRRRVAGRKSRVATNLVAGVSRARLCLWGSGFGLLGRHGGGFGRAVSCERCEVAGTRKTQTMLDSRRNGRETRVEKK